MNYSPLSHCMGTVYKGRSPEGGGWGFDVVDENGHEGGGWFWQNGCPLSTTFQNIIVANTLQDLSRYHYRAYLGSHSSVNMVIQQMSSNFQAELIKRISSRNYVPHEKLYSSELSCVSSKVILSFWEGGLRS